MSFVATLVGILSVAHVGHAWTEASVQTVHTYVSVDEDGRARVSMQLLMRVHGGWLEGLDLEGLDPNLSLDPMSPPWAAREQHLARPTTDEPAADEATADDEKLAPAVSELSFARQMTDGLSTYPLPAPAPVGASLAEMVEPPMSVWEKFPVTVQQVKSGHVRLSLRKRSPRRGSLWLGITYTTELSEHAMALRGDRVHVQWTLPAWRTGLDAVKVFFTAPSGVTPVAQGHDSGVAMEVTNFGPTTQIAIERPHLPRTTPWTIAFEAPTTAFSKTLIARLADAKFEAGHPMLDPAPDETTARDEDASAQATTLSAPAVTDDTPPLWLWTVFFLPLLGLSLQARARFARAAEGLGTAARPAVPSSTWGPALLTVVSFAAAARFPSPEVWFASLMAAAALGLQRPPAAPHKPLSADGSLRVLRGEARTRLRLEAAGRRTGSRPVAGIADLSTGAGLFLGIAALAVIAGLRQLALNVPAGPLSTVLNLGAGGSLPLLLPYLWLFVSGRQSQLPAGAAVGALRLYALAERFPETDAQRTSFGVLAFCGADGAPEEVRLRLSRHAQGEAKAAVRVDIAIAERPELARMVHTFTVIAQVPAGLATMLTAARPPKWVRQHREALLDGGFRLIARGSHTYWVTEADDPSEKARVLLDALEVAQAQLRPVSLDAVTPKAA